MSQPPEHPGTPADPERGDQTPPGYPPERGDQTPPGYPPPPGYGTPPPPPPGYGTPPPPPPGYGTPPPPPPGYGAPPPAPGYGRHASPPPGSPGGYGPPPGQAPPTYGTPPPAGPPAGYGMPPAGYPPPPGYAAPPGGPIPPQFSVGEAVRWAGNKFTQNAVTLIVPVLVYGVLIALLAGVAAGLPPLLGQSTATTSTDSYGNSVSGTEVTLGAASYAVMVVGYILLFIVGIFMSAALLTGCLDIADGKPVSIGSFFKPRNLGPVLLTAVLIALGTWIGTLACVIPGLIFAFLVQFALPFVIDRSLSPVDSIKASIATTRSNLGGAFLSWLVQGAIVLVGELLCGVGLLAALPIALLIQVYTYRKLSGGQVVAQDQPSYQPGPPPGIPPGPQPA
jgi:uncharacterized membrane protein